MQPLIDGLIFIVDDDASVREADELLLSSASKEIMPVTLLDGRPIGSGTPGPVFARLYAAYQRAKNDQSI